MRAAKPTPGEWYVVNQGDSVESVAVSFGHLLATIWDASENRELRARRKDPHVLLPGDRLFIPPIRQKVFSVATGSVHKFIVQRPSSRIRLQLLNRGKPRANEPFLLVVDGEEERGTTDGEGRIDRPIPPLARKATLTVGEGEEATVYPLELRHLDPVTEITGLQGRLSNLGYDVGPIDALLGWRTRNALCAFQRDERLEVTGELDEATRNKLQQKHSS